MPEKGLLSFIKSKLEHSVDPVDIKRMLLRAGFDESSIDAAFDHVRMSHADTHQDLAAVNDFLPPLAKKAAAPSSVQMPSSSVRSSARARITDIPLEAGARKTAPSLKREAAPVHEFGPGELFRGRLRRKDFILGFLFFFGIGYVILSFGAVFVSLLFPDLWESVLLTIQRDANGLFLLTIPIILAPVTVMMLSLIWRRFHNIGLPGGLSMLYLTWFVPSSGASALTGMWALHAALIVMFIMLLTFKGSPEPNRYGPFPSSKGSFFRRIFNL